MMATILYSNVNLQLKNIQKHRRGQYTGRFSKPTLSDRVVCFRLQPGTLFIFE